MQITSTSNEQIKAVRKLRSRKGRMESGLFYVEGLRHIGAAIEKQAPIEQIIFCPSLLVSEFGLSLVAAARAQGLTLMEVSEAVFASLSDKAGPQGLAAVVRQNWLDLQASDTHMGLWLALEDVQDPGNLGAALRSLDAAGGRGLILLEQGTDVWHPSAVRASMGAIFSQSIVKTNTAAFAAWRQAHQTKVVGTWCGETKPYRQVIYPQNIILLMGSEQKGLQEEHVALCDDLVHIPMYGQVDSLNLACAASIVLFEISHQLAEGR